MDLSNSNLVVQMIVGLIALAVGLGLVKTNSLALKIVGLIVAVGGTVVLLEPVPVPFVSTATALNLKFLIVTVVFAAASILIARTGPGNGAKLTGALLAFLGFLALFVQIGSLFVIPGGVFGDIIESSFDAISKIFAQANSQLN